MRTYSLTVPLEERTFTGLGYMRTIITTNHGESREICGNSRKTLNQIVTTLFGPTGGPLREEPGNQGVFAHGSCRPGWLHPKHGLGGDGPRSRTGGPGHPQGSDPSTAIPGGPIDRPAPLDRAGV